MSLREIEVVAAIFAEGDRVFATQRGYGPDKDGWEFPGGKVEPGEELLEALKREIREELDTEMEGYRELPVVTMDYPTFTIRLHCFLSRVKSGGLTLKEHEAARWVSRRDLLSLDWLPADRVVAELLMDMDWGADEDES